MRFLYQTIKEILETGRVGTPVFVRCVVQILPISDDIVDTVARILMIAGSWFEAAPIRVYAQTQDFMQITASVQYTGGQNAIISVNIANDLPPRVDLMMLGNKGALYHDGESLPEGFDITFDSTPIPEWLIEALERSLENGRPANIEEVLDFD